MIVVLDAQFKVTKAHSVIRPTIGALFVVSPEAKQRDIYRKGFLGITHKTTSEVTRPDDL